MTERMREILLKALIGLGVLVSALGALIMLILPWTAQILADALTG